MDDIKQMFKAILEPVFDMAVNNAKKDEKIENENVDKRKLIEEVAGLMKSAGCDDELIRTAIGKMEKIGYDKSEKVENTEEETKTDELKTDLKKDVKNKCDEKVENSKTDFFAQMNTVYNNAKAYEPQSDYISRADRLKAGEEMFRK